MKKRIMLILCLGVSFAPPAFALGEIPKASMFDKRSIHCAGVPSNSDRKETETRTESAPRPHSRTHSEGARS